MKRNVKRIVKRTAVSIYSAVLFFMINTKQIDASSFASSKLATGTTKLIADVTTWAMGTSIAAIILIAIYFWLRKSGANDQEQARWDKALKRILICVVGIGTTSAVINLLLSYYK
ncbi:hypothetical protein [[Clostridium] polysaccharolyticum]|uniref:Uncharacterized protein n=1 Tax=[Clostridium] polysaccharolyticum TaxID=29364 RepID=A0A1H9Y8K2_9FIRM|nr:hypothetical protein [[Clostridium] polysaccharolyticum]SES65112.1 hypothetical protein SAMN04487772_101210 [[Clostridium] polysaccharolyticum]